MKAFIVIVGAIAVIGGVLFWEVSQKGAGEVQADSMLSAGFSSGVSAVAAEEALPEGVCSSEQAVEESCE